MELSESLHDTLVGTVITETDRIMKEFGSNSIYLPRDKRRAFDWRSRLQVDENDYAKLDEDYAKNNSKIEAAFLEAGGIDLGTLDPEGPFTYMHLVEKMYMENGIKGHPVDALCLTNIKGQLLHHGSSICSTDRVKIFAHGRLQQKNGEIESYNTDDLESTKYLAERLKKLPIFAKQFALLEAIYSVSPVVQLMVMSGNIPDFSKLPAMRHYETETTQSPVFVRKPDISLNGARSPVQLKSLLDTGIRRGDYSHISLGIGGGCTYDNGFTTREASLEDFKKEKSRLKEEARKQNSQNRQKGNGGNGGEIDKDRVRAAWDRSDPIMDLVKAIKGQRDHPDYGRI